MNKLITNEALYTIRVEGLVSVLVMENWNWKYQFRLFLVSTFRTHTVFV